MQYLSGLPLPLERPSRNLTPQPGGGGGGGGARVPAAHPHPEIPKVPPRAPQPSLPLAVRKGRMGTGLYFAWLPDYYWPRQYRSQKNKVHELSTPEIEKSLSFREFKSSRVQSRWPEILTEISKWMGRECKCRVHFTSRAAKIDILKKIKQQSLIIDFGLARGFELAGESGLI